LLIAVLLRIASSSPAIHTVTAQNVYASRLPRNKGRHHEDVDSTPSLLNQYPEEQRETVLSCARQAVHKYKMNENDAATWLDDQADIAISEWLNETRQDLVEVRAEVATRYTLAAKMVLFYATGRSLHHKASKIGKKTKSEVGEFINDLNLMGKETGDWLGVYSILITWVAPYLE
jgi:hypothetical protein